jgi:cell division protein FtsN
MIATYIKELLKNHSRVIVPDLGAFLRKNDNPDLLYFNEFLRFNDGLLVDYVAEKEGVDKIEAAKRVKNYVAEINNTLKEKESFDLTEIGTLYLDNTDKIQLKVDLLKVYIPENKEQPEKLKIEEIKEEVVPPAPAPKEKIKSKAETEKEPIIISQNEVPPVEEKKPKKSSVVSVPEEPKAEVPPSQETIYTPEVEYTEDNRRGFRIIWIIIILLFILAFLVWYYILRPKFNEPEQDFPVKKDTTTVISNPTNETNTNNAVKETPKKEKPAPPVPIVEKTAKMYYLVSGCFAMESNADKLIATLKSKGFNAEKFAKIEEMYFVSIASFKDKASAEAELSKLKAQGYECWIKRY